MQSKIQEQLKLLPTNPGVYLMKNEQAKIIYVGKAINLKNRVKSYFQSSKNHSPKVKSMVEKISDFEYIITANEIEALILECNLIKKYRPKYNISLRDDKTYPYIKVTLNEDYPTVSITRKILKDGAKYFGPYTSAGAVHEVLNLLKKLFQIRSCRQMNTKRPCLEFHIKRCLAPCTGRVAKSEYREMIKSLCLFLEGRNEVVLKELTSRMQIAAENFQFELAAKLRDQVLAIEKISAKQNIIIGSSDQDIIGLARKADEACIQIFFIRSGKMIGRDHFLLNGTEDETDSALLNAFLEQYYNKATFIPKEILLPAEIENEEILSAWLSQKKNAKVSFGLPQRGVKKEMVLMANDNAVVVLEEQMIKNSAGLEQTVGAMKDLGRYLRMEKELKRIECFDISHIQGSETVASMVVFSNGAPDKQEYRRYKLKSVEGKPDDFKSMQEVVGRRYRQSDGIMPDLIIIDGGKGQLNSALEIIRALGHYQIPVVGLAKQFEYVFLEGQSEPVILPPNSKALYLIQRIRDEAHRFAITYHRKLRHKRNLVSVLDHIEGVGPTRRKALWDAFGSIAEIKKAKITDLTAVPGISENIANNIVKYFKNSI
ncbi:MAG: excinuclease ABC subunit UvrC [Negativicutes bacterium]|nr:excinuclease ABC subunit UvrC [Negativicutes bacterium]MBP9949106.1 excinuclease ABC subunit UvrC [Negativicutes bacterium]